MTKNLLFTLSFMLAFLGLDAQTIYFTEDLESGVPADWVIDGDFAYGTSTTLGSQFFSLAGNETSFLAFNDDDLGNGHVGGGSVTTGAIDLTSAEAPVIMEANFFWLNGDYQGADETFVISTSIDGGETFEYFAEPSVGTWNYAILDFEQFIGQSVILRFEYDDGAGWNFGAGLDDISIASEPVNLARRNYSLTANGGSVTTRCAENIDYPVEGIFINNGWETVTSFDVNVTTISGDPVISQSFDGLELGLGDAIRYEMSEKLNTGTSNANYSVSVSNVNGVSEEDENTADNMAFVTFAPISVHPDKGVTVEEATGTWCQWCPRGTVFLDEMSKRFGKQFVGIAVHNGDPMVNTEYDAAIRAFPGFSGYPSVVYNRSELLDPSAIVNPTIADLAQAPVATLELGGSEDGDMLTTNVKVTFLEDVTSADYNVVVILTEDGLMETGDGWAQVNAYSGGGNGTMGGFELLSTGVSAELWPYDHVGRELVSGYAGLSIESADYVAGESTIVDFPATAVSSEYVKENMHIAVLLTDGTGAVVNAASGNYNDVIANGPTSILEIEDDAIAMIYPNPVNEIANLALDIKESAEVTVEILDVSGKVIDVRSLGTFNGKTNTNMSVSSLNPGNYFFKINAGNYFTTKKVVVIK